MRADTLWHKWKKCWTWAAVAAGSAAADHSVAATTGTEPGAQPQQTHIEAGALCPAAGQRLGQLAHPNLGCANLLSDASPGYPPRRCACSCSTTRGRSAK